MSQWELSLEIMCTPCHEVIKYMDIGYVRLGCRIAYWSRLDCIRGDGTLGGKSFDVVHHISPGAYAGSRKCRTFSMHLHSHLAADSAASHSSTAALMTRSGF